MTAVPSTGPGNEQTAAVEPAQWPINAGPEDQWRPALRGACFRCGRIVPTASIVASKSYEYDDWEIYGECSKHGETDVVVIGPAR